MLGIGIPYYKNSEECEVAFKKLVTTIDRQITNDMTVIYYEDGQISDWLEYYDRGRTKVLSNLINNGVAFARNVILRYLKQAGCDYILFLDSDDMVDCNYLDEMLKACKEGIYDLIESPFYVNGREYQYYLRDNVSGCAISMKLIGDLEFSECYNVSEDTIFIHTLYDKKKELKRFMINARYFYNYGINPNSLMMRFERSEIKLMKEV